MEKWDFRYRFDKTTRYSQLVNKINVSSNTRRKVLVKLTTRYNLSRIFRLKTQFSRLNHHMSKILPDQPSLCKTCNTRETTEHFLLDCRQYPLLIQEFHKSLKEIIMSNQIYIEDILGESALDLKQVIQVRQLLQNFLNQTRKKI